MTIPIENWFTAIFLPALPMCCLSFGSEISFLKELASAFASWAGTKIPFSPFITVSLQPETSVVTIGRPQAEASINTLGNPSA